MVGTTSTSTLPNAFTRTTSLTTPPAALPYTVTRLKFAKAEADFEQPVRPLAPIFDDKTGTARVTGPAQFAIDGKNKTAWGIDAGPGRRNTDRKAVFNAERNVAFPTGTVLTFHLVSKHGGWSNNDHQQANLGRFRLSVTDDGHCDRWRQLPPRHTRGPLLAG